MIADIIRAVIQRIFRDKIVLGLVIIGVLSIFMMNSHGGERTSELPPEKQQAHEQAIAAQGNEPENQAKKASSGESAKKSEAGEEGPLEPTLACNFIKWWLGGAMDYHRETAQKNHEEAFHWMSKEAHEAFQSAFWSDQVAQGVASGGIIAAFQPITVEAEAVNPDGSVVVLVKGTLVMQLSGQPSTQPIETDFLVKKEPAGLRIESIYNRQISHKSNGYY